jgi:hypothetical protein
MKKENNSTLGKGCVIFILIVITVAITTYIILDRRSEKLDKESEKELTAEQIYPGPWREPTMEEIRVISIALSRSDIPGCGEYYVRKSSHYTNEYLIACNYHYIEKGRWEYYIVWALTGKAMSVRGLEIKDMHLIKAPY